jgi:hypothetical protein
MKYLDDADIAKATARIMQAVHMGPLYKEVKADRQAPEKIKRTARAFTRALERNGGPFANRAEAREATRDALRAEAGWFARALSAMLSLVATLYPQTALFVWVFDILFELWLQKNTTTVSVTH